jgi:hypothetical protein
MKIDYNVLWIEDDKSWYETTSEILKENVDNYGFNLKALRKGNYNEVKEELETNGLKKYDIFLIDFTLKNSETGDVIIEHLRHKDIYTDIIFYSSAIENVKESMHHYWMEGVYYADRKEIETKFELVFNTTIKKIQEINSMRGLVVGETSELDVYIEDITCDLVTKLGLDEEILDELITNIVKYNTGRNEKLFDEYKAVGFQNFFHKIEAMKKWKIFRDILKHNQFKTDENIKAFLHFNSTYFDDVIDVRNKFAHAKSVEDGGRTVLLAQIGKEDFVYDDDKFVSIRKNLKNHRDNFDRLNNYLDRSIE